MSDTNHNPAHGYPQAEALTARSTTAPSPLATVPHTISPQITPSSRPLSTQEATRLAIQQTTHERDTHYTSQLRTLRTRLAVSEHESSAHAKREFERGIKQGFKNGEEHAKSVGKKTWLKEAYQKGYRDGQKKVRGELKTVVERLRGELGDELRVLEGIYGKGKSKEEGKGKEKEKGKGKDGLLSRAGSLIKREEKQS